MSFIIIDIMTFVKQAIESENFEKFYKSWEI